MLHSPNWAQSVTLWKVVPTTPCSQWLRQYSMRYTTCTCTVQQHQVNGVELILWGGVASSLCLSCTHVHVHDARASPACTQLSPLQQSLANWATWWLQLVSYRDIVPAPPSKEAPRGQLSVYTRGQSTNLFTSKTNFNASAITWLHDSITINIPTMAQKQT